MALACKRAIIFDEYKSRTLNNDKPDSKTFQNKMFQGYLNYIFANFRDFENLVASRRIEPTTLW